MMDKKTCQKTAELLVLVGAVNLGLIGLGDLTGNNLDVLNMLLGSWPTVESLVYVVVGLSGLKMAHKAYM